MVYWFVPHVILAQSHPALVHIRPLLTLSDTNRNRAYVVRNRARMEQGKNLLHSQVPKFKPFGLEVANCAKLPNMLVMASPPNVQPELTVVG